MEHYAYARKGHIGIELPSMPTIFTTPENAQKLLDDLPAAISLAQTQAWVSRAQLRIPNPAASVGSDTL